MNLGSQSFHLTTDFLLLEGCSNTLSFIFDLQLYHHPKCELSILSDRWIELHETVTLDCTHSLI